MNFAPNSTLKLAPERRWLVRILLIAAAVGCVCLGFAAVTPRNGIRVQDLESDLRNTLPPGSPKGLAEQWFAANGIQFRIMTQVTNGLEVGYHAQIDNSSWFESAEIRIAVGFDVNGRVTKVSIYRFVTVL
jgi:hypothetical protein